MVNCYICIRDPYFYKNDDNLKLKYGNQQFYKWIFNLQKCYLFILEDFLSM